MEYDFKNPPAEIKYTDEEPLKFTKEFGFFHNKIQFRKNITKLQNIVKEYLPTSIVAAGIRDSYLKAEFTEKFLILLLTTIENHKLANDIIEPHANRTINKGCFYIETNSKYMLLLAKDMDGLISGIDTVEEILIQTFEHYFKRKNFDEFIKIRPFVLNTCK